jgi:hypothetical protein
MNARPLAPAASRVGRQGRRLLQEQGRLRERAGSPHHESHAAHPIWPAVPAPAPAPAPAIPAPAFPAAVHRHLSWRRPDAAPPVPPMPPLHIPPPFPPPPPTPRIGASQMLPSGSWGALLVSRSVHSFLHDRAGGCYRCRCNSVGRLTAGGPPQRSRELGRGAAKRREITPDGPGHARGRARLARGRVEPPPSPFAGSKGAWSRLAQSTVGPAGGRGGGDAAFLRQVAKCMAWTRRLWPACL